MKIYTVTARNRETGEMRYDFIKANSTSEVRTFFEYQPRNIAFRIASIKEWK